MPEIDPTRFVLVEGDRASLKFEDPKQQGKFELGVCMAIHNWDELTTAVDNSWGGPNSADKRDWLSGVVIDLFLEKGVDIILIEETLLYAMMDEFYTEIDNDSALEVGDLIIQIYKECLAQDYAHIDQLYARYQEKQANGLSKTKVNISRDPNNADISDDESEEEEEEVSGLENDAMIIDLPGSTGAIVDDDGFELVTRMGRRR